MLAIKTLMNIQKELKAPKNQFNKFGGYHYRNCEDILEALKPLLESNNAVVTLTDDVVYIDGRHYIKATATLHCFDDNQTKAISVSALAREEETKKGMDASQISGAASSYARKYALNGLFAIDDTKDSDTTNTGDNATKQAKSSAPKQEHTEINNEAKTSANEPQMTYKEALLVQFEGRTLHEIYKTDGRKHISTVYELADDNVKRAIEIIEAYITSSK